MVRKSQTVVTLDAKLSSVNIKSIPTDGTVTIVEGQPFKIDANGLAATAESASPDAPAVVFLNFTDSSRTDVSFLQGDPTDDTAPTIGVRGGGLAGIIGNGVSIGLPASVWHGGTLPTLGQYVKINGTSGLFAGTSATLDDAFYGIVYQVANGRAYFMFHSTPFVVNATG